MQWKYSDGGVMRYIIITVLLSGCSVSEPNDISEPHTSYNIVCLNGVKYYEGAKRIAPYVDAKTLQFERCEE